MSMIGFLGDVRFPITNPNDLILEFARYYTNRADTWAGFTTFQGIRCEKYPTDLWLYQQFIYALHPDFIIETGTQHGGTSLYLACLCEWFGYGRVYTIDIRPTPPQRLLQHPRLTLLTMDSVGVDAQRFVAGLLATSERGMVILDSAHSAAHVQRELELYAPLVGHDQLLIVEDTHLGYHTDNPNTPRPAVEAFLSAHPEFQVHPDSTRFLLTASPGGCLQRN